MYESLALLSETVLSAYPILIKKVDASLTVQTIIRMATFSILAGSVAIGTGAPLLQGATAANVFGPGLLNLLHVGASYSAFDALPAGNAMAIFYTYPVWNLLGAAMAFKEKIPVETIPWMTVAMLGALMIAQPTGANWSMFGVLAALIAALTETGIYLWFRTEPVAESNATANATATATPQPWTTMARMYGGSGILLAVLLLTGILTVGSMGGKGSLSTMLLFNVLIGFLGYAMRFFTIPYISTIGFSVISFFGIVSAYLFGWFFVGETPNIMQGIGAAMVIAANVFLIRKETV